MKFESSKTVSLRLDVKRDEGAILASRLVCFRPKSDIHAQVSKDSELMEHTHARNRRRYTHFQFGFVQKMAPPESGARPCRCATNTNPNTPTRMWCRAKRIAKGRTHPRSRTCMATENAIESMRWKIHGDFFSSAGLRSAKISMQSICILSSTSGEVSRNVPRGPARPRNDS